MRDATSKKRIWFGNPRRLTGDRRAWNESTAAEFGFDISETLSGADIAFIYNLPILDWLEMRLLGGGKPRIQFLTEPSVVRPLAHNRLLVKAFSRRFMVGRTETGGIFYPQIFPDEFPLGGGDRLPRVALINANKFSFLPGELYSLRRLCASKLPQIDTFGYDWDIGLRDTVRRLLFEFAKALVSLRGLKLAQPGLFNKPLSPKGPIANKLEVLGKYKVALVTENSAEYMSEKLFDALFAGCIPVYVGPDLSAWDIPAELYVKSKPDVQSVQTAIHEALSRDLMKHLEACKLWLSDPKTKRDWEYHAVLARMFSEILD